MILQSSNVRQSPYPAPIDTVGLVALSARLQFYADDTAATTSDNRISAVDVEDCPCDETGSG